MGQREEDMYLALASATNEQGNPSPSMADSVGSPAKWRRSTHSLPTMQRTQVASCENLAARQEIGPP